MEQIDTISLLEKYCIDTNSILDFWDSDRYRPYPVKIAKFRQLWDRIALRVEQGTIIIPKVVHKEIKTYNQELKDWLEKNKSKFVSEENCFSELSEVVKEFRIYTTKKASLNDAIIVAIAKHRGLTIITSERRVQNHSLVKPKIPNVCDKFSVPSINLSEFFVKEKL